MKSTLVASLTLGLILSACGDGSGYVEQSQLQVTPHVFATQLTSVNPNFIGTGYGRTMSPNDMYQHYNIPTTLPSYGNIALNGAGTTIAIVDAPGSSNVSADCNTFSAMYRLAPCVVQQINLGGTVNPKDDWALEVNLDVQWAHAIAPGATILLVTAKSSAPADMMAAVQTAVTYPNVVAVSMSWGITEQAYEVGISYDGFFSKYPGIAFFAAAGDSGNNNNQQSWPAASPHVTAVGGTSLIRLGPAAPGAEKGWVLSGGGYSKYEPMPTYQTALLTAQNKATVNNNKRAIPDVAYNADSVNSPVAVYVKGNWYGVGGTSAGAPQWAGIVAIWSQYMTLKKSSLQQLLSYNGGLNSVLYQTKYDQNPKPSFFDILLGSNNTSSNPCAICTAGTGYDDVTGLGEPNVANLLSYF